MAGSQAVERGLNIAIRMRQLDQQRESLRLQKETFEVQAGQKIQGLMNQILAGPKENMALNKRRLMEFTARIGRPISEETINVLASDENRENAISTMAFIGGLPDNQKARTYVQATTLLMGGDPIKIGQALSQGAQFRMSQLQAEQKQLVTLDTRLRDIQQKTFSNEQALRKEFENLPEIKDFKNANSAFRTLDKLLQQSTGAGDVAAIFNFMKTLDPGGRVTESEVTLTENAPGWLQKIANTVNKYRDGTLFKDKARQEIRQAALEGMQSNQEAATRAAGEFQKIAKSKNLDPNLVVRDIGIKGAAGRIASVRGQAATANLLKKSNARLSVLSDKFKRSADKTEKREIIKEMNKLRTDMANSILKTHKSNPEAVRRAQALLDLVKKMEQSSKAR